MMKHFQPPRNEIDSIYPPSRWARWASLAMVLPLGLLTILMVEDLIAFTSDPKAYPIGAEAAGWVYASPRNYLLNLALSLLVCVLGLLLPELQFVRRRGNAGVWIRAATIGLFALRLVVSIIGRG